MSDSEKPLGVKISISADTAGAQAASKGLEDVAKKTEESGKKSEFLGLKFGELKKLARELGHEFPLVGMAARLMLQPIEATMVIAIGLFAQAKERLDEWNKSLEESAQKLAEGTWLEAITKRREAVEKAQVSNEKWLAGLDAAANAEITLERAANAATEAIKQQEQANAKVADAQFGFDAAKLKLELDRGLVSQAQYFLALGELEKKHEAEKLQRERTANIDALARQALNLRDAADRGPGLRSAAEAAGNAAANASGRTTQHEAELQAVIAELPELKKKADEALAAAEASHKVFQTVGNAAFAKEQDARAAAAVGARDQAADAIKKLIEQIGHDQTAAIKADQDAGEKRKSAEANKEFVDSQQRDLAAKQRAYDISNPAATTTSATRNATTDIGTLESLMHDNEPLTQVSQIASLVQAHKQITLDQKSLLANYQQFLADHGQGFASSIQRLATATSNLGAMRAEIEAIRRALDQQRRQSGGVGN